jgi:hypothetical protein
MLRLCASVCALTLLLSACTDDEVVVGSQCPAAPSGDATLADGAVPSLIHGTSCAPCEGDKPTLDPHGCPVLVTWASCGGDICIGQQLVPQPVLDAGGADGGPDAGDAGPDASADAGPINPGDDDAGGTGAP